MEHTQVGVPAKPATVASIDVHGDVGKVEVLESIGNALLVAIRRVLAGGKVGVGDQVRERVGLNDQCEGGVWSGLEHLNDRCRRLSLAA